MSDRVAELRIPVALRPRAAIIIDATDRFCAEHLDAEYAELCRRLVARLARKRPSPLARGDLTIWAGAALYAIGTLNFLFDATQRPHLTSAELCRMAGVSQATASNKARDIRTLLGLAPFDPELSRREVKDASPLRKLVEVGGLIVPADLIDTFFDDESDEALLKSLDAADRDALELLREALPELRNVSAPVDLQAAAAALRRDLLAGLPDLLPVARANGWSRRLPADDRQLWIESAGALVRMRNDTGLTAEEESLLMTVEHADVLGAILGAVRAGPGAYAGAAQLTAYIDSCPEIEGEVDDEDRELIEAAFELLVPVWMAAGALDADSRLTELGRWGLPRALAWAWGGDLDTDLKG